MGKYQKELIPNKSQPNLDEVGVKTKRTERWVLLEILN